MIASPPVEELKVDLDLYPSLSVDELNVSPALLVNEPSLDTPLASRDLSAVPAPPSEPVIVVIPWPSIDDPEIWAVRPSAAVTFPCLEIEPSSCRWRVTAELPPSDELAHSSLSQAVSTCPYRPVLGFENWL